MLKKRREGVWVNRTICIEQKADHALAEIYVKRLENSKNRTASRSAIVEDAIMLLYKQEIPKP